MKTLAFCRILWYNVYMENREMQTSNTEEMVTISRAEYERLQQEKARNAKLEAKLAAREQEQVLRLQAPELHALADSLVDSIFHNYLHDRLDYKKKERRIVAATIRKIHAPNQLAAVFDVSGSPLENLL